MSLTCISCKLLFSVAKLHQEHYKTDFHRYNLKRRIADLPPISKEEYEKRAAAFQAANKEKETTSLKCNSCNKHFSSQNAMTSHLKSKKHLDVEAQLKKYPKEMKPPILKDVSIQVDEKNIDYEDFSDDDDNSSGWESCDDSSDEDGVTRVVVDTNDCLFCDYQSDSTEDNVVHMTKVHSFYIPDIEYVSDLDGLIGFLAGKLHIAHICLWCDNKSKNFKSLKAARQHMFDKGHCKMLFEGDALVDYADFYDYSSNEANEAHFDEEIIEQLLQDSEYELVLPSGSTIGHRSLAQYYKQNLRPIAYDNAKKVKTVLQHYKALDYGRSKGPAAMKKARDIMFVQRVKSRYNLKLGIKNNRFQPHYRPQVMF